MYIPSKLIERFDDLLVNNCTVYTSGKTKKFFFNPKLNEDKYNCPGNIYECQTATVIRLNETS